MKENLNKLFEKKIKNNIKNKNYSECISLLKNKINEIFSYKISKEVDEFKYTCLIDLLDIVSPVLSSDDSYLLNQYYLTVRNDSVSEFKVYKLMEIYKKLKVTL